MIYFKKHQRVYQDGVSTIVAMCDEELIGKKLKGKNSVLDLAAYANFYKGDLISSEKALEIFSGFFASGGGRVSFNLVGKKVIKVASKFIDVSKASKFKSVPHLQVYKV